MHSTIPAPTTPKSNERDAASGSVLQEGPISRCWKYDGWTEQDWECLTEDSGTLNALARAFDRAIGGGGGGFTPEELAEFQGLLDAMAGRFKRIRNNYY